MAHALRCVAVVDDGCAASCDGRAEGGRVPCTSYSEYSLTQCLQFIGCKPRRSQKVARKVFWLLAERERSGSSPGAAPIRNDWRQGGSRDPGSDDRGSSARLALSRVEFEDLVLSCLGEHPRHLADATTKLKYFQSACRVVVERTETLLVLLCGTSGTGKSTLASLVASRLGIAHVMSTDVIRNLLRGLDVGRNQGYLWKSTYEKAEDAEEEKGGGVGKGDAQFQGVGDSADLPPHFLQQRGAILERAELLVESFVRKRKESLIIEGVHLSGAFADRMMSRFPEACVAPFLVHISNRDKHLERFAVRAKAMALRPDSNRYVKHLGSIRTIQRRLIDEADELQIPRVDNTNVDRSLAAIHETVLGVLAEEGSGTMQGIQRIFLSKIKGNSGKDAKAQIRALRLQMRSESPLSSTTSMLTLNRPSTAPDQGPKEQFVDRDVGFAPDIDANDDGSDENDSEYQDVLHEMQIRVGNDHEGDGSVNTHDETTTQGMSLNE